MANEVWLLTGFYGIPEISRRRESWSFLSLINHGPNIQWSIIGDFNEIMKQDEKVRGRCRPIKKMVNFQEGLENNNLFDIGWRGQKFT